MCFTAIIKINQKVIKHAITYNIRTFAILMTSSKKLIFVI